MSIDSVAAEESAVDLAIARCSTIACYFDDPDPIAWDRVIQEARAYQGSAINSEERQLLLRDDLDPHDLETKMVLWIVLAQMVEDLRLAFCRVYLDGDVPIRTLNPHRESLEVKLDPGSTPEESLKLYKLLHSVMDGAKRGIRRVLLQARINRLRRDHLAVVHSFVLDPTVQVVLGQPDILSSVSAPELDQYERACDLIEQRVERLLGGVVKLQEDYVLLRNMNSGSVLEEALKTLSLQHRRALVRELKADASEEDVLARLIALDYYQEEIEKIQRQKEATRDEQAAVA